MNGLREVFLENPELRRNLRIELSSKRVVTAGIITAVFALIVLPSLLPAIRPGISAGAFGSVSFYLMAILWSQRITLTVGGGDFVLAGCEARTRTEHLRFSAYHATFATRVGGRQIVRRAGAGLFCHSVSCSAGTAFGCNNKWCRRCAACAELRPSLHGIAGGSRIRSHDLDRFGQGGIG